jgi:hypothetical protein
MTKQLYYFNPGHEAAILNHSPYYMAPANVTRMQEELAYLPAWYANEKDYILIPKNLPNVFSTFFVESELKLAQGITVNKLALNHSNLKVHLWGLSPQAVHYFNQLNTQYNLNLRVPLWNDSLYQLSSRETAKECLTILSERISSISSSILPKFYDNLEEINNVVTKSNFQLLSKAPYSSSGRGLLWLPIGNLTRTEKQILHGMLKKQGKVSIERALNKKVDFAMEFTISNNIISFVGYSLFETNGRGAYQGNYIGSQAKIIDQITSYINTELLEEVKEQLTSILQTKFKDTYTGCIGVDMMIYQDNESYYLHPCLEINVRDNMGLLAINLYKKHIAPTSEGFFYIDFSNKESEILDRDIQMKELYPTLFCNNKIKSGYLSLCPIYPESKYRAYIIIKE